MALTLIRAILTVAVLALGLPLAAQPAATHPDATPEGAPAATEQPPAPEPTAGDEAPPPLSAEELGLPAPGEIRLPPSLEEQITQQLALLGRTWEQQQKELGRGAVLRAIIGFVLLLTLAYLAGHPRVLAFEQRLRFNPLITSGMPFLLLGFFASSPQIGILTERTITETSPLVPLGLGWIGFRIGYYFNESLLDTMPHRAGLLSAVSIAIPTGMIVAVVLAIRAVLGPSSPDLGPVRDLLLLGLAGSAGSVSAATFRIKGLAVGDSLRKIGRYLHVELIALLLALLLISVYFRPPEGTVAWELPGTAWLFLTLGLGLTMGALTTFLFRSIGAGPQFALALLGSIAFTAGLSSFLRLSTMSVCFIAGLVSASVPYDGKQVVADVLARVERPVFYLFLILAGAMWRYDNWVGWVMAALVVAGRFAGKYVAFGSRLAVASRGFSATERRSLILAPVGGPSIAVIMSAYDLYRTPSVAWMVTAILTAAVVTEIAEGLMWRSAPPDEAAGGPLAQAPPIMAGGPGA